MDNHNLKKISDELIKTFIFAGKKSIKLRELGLKKETKPDNTPVTNGDIEVNNILTEKIKNVTPEIPIISEESTSNKSQTNMSNFWLIDPIDGTYDYISNKDEFTLNAGLIINKKPVLGIIYAPAKVDYFTRMDMGIVSRSLMIKKLNLLVKKTKANQVKAVSYSQNLKPEIAELHKKFGVTEFTKMKSSLKFCVVATSEYDLYVAEPRACEWDIAAGHAILENAGGIITDFSGNEIFYGKKDFKNSSLILKRGKNL